MKSSDFHGKTSFCINKNSIDLVIKELLQMNNSLEEKCEIQDYDSDSYILLEMESYGHMKFAFKSDQSILVNLIQLFKAFLI